MNIHELCSICPSKFTCDDSIKKFNFRDSGSVVIMGEPVACPGPYELVRVIDKYGTREFFHDVPPPIIFDNTLADRLRHSVPVLEGMAAASLIISAASAIKELLTRTVVRV